MKATLPRRPSARSLVPASEHGASYVRLAGVGRRPRVNARVISARRLDKASDDVAQLIDAAGPLTVYDIAGGLDISLSDASTRVQAMVAGNCLRPDEWDRYQLAGDCRD